MAQTDPRRSLLNEREDLYRELGTLKKEASGEHADLLLRRETVLAERMKTLLVGIATLENDTILEEIPPPEANILTQRIKAYRLRVTALREQFNVLQKELREALDEKPLEASDAPSIVSSAPLPGKRPSRRFEYPQDPDLPPKDTGPDVKKKTHIEVSEVADETFTLDNPKEIRSVYGPVVYGADEGGRPDKPNEDRVAVETKGKPGIFDAAFAVIDGMGGHGNGDRAAQILGETILANLDRNGLQMEEGEDPDKWEKGRPVERVVLQRLAREAILRGIPNNPNPGAVYSLGVFLGDKLKIYHAGDTKVVVFDVQGNVKLETINHGIGSDVGNAVSGYRKGFTDVLECTVQPGDRIVFTSDGLTDNFKNPNPDPTRLFDQFDAASLYELIKEKSPEEAMRIISADLKNKMAQGKAMGFKKDNRSVIIVDIEQIPGQAPNNPPEKEPEVEVSDAEAQAVIGVLIQERVDALDRRWIDLTNEHVLKRYPAVEKYSQEIFSDAKEMYIDKRKKGASHEKVIQEIQIFVESRHDFFLTKETQHVSNLFDKLMQDRVILYDAVLGPYTIYEVRHDGAILVQYETTRSVQEKYHMSRLDLPRVFGLAETLSNSYNRHALAPFASDPSYNPDDRKRFAQLAEEAREHVFQQIPIARPGGTPEDVLAFWSRVFQNIGVRANELGLDTMEKANLYENALYGLLSKDEKKLLDDLKSKTEEDVANEYCDQLPSGVKEAADQFELLTYEMKRGDITVWEDIERVKQMDPSIGREIDDIVYDAMSIYKQAIDSKRSREEAKQEMEQEFTRLYQELVDREIGRCYDVIEICKEHNTLIPYTDLGDVQILQVDRSTNSYTLRTESGEEKKQWLVPGSNINLSSLIYGQFVDFGSRWGQEFVPFTYQENETPYTEGRDSTQKFFFHLAERMRSYNPSDWRSSIEGYWGPLLLDMETEAERLYLTKSTYAEILPWVFNHIYSLPVADLFPVDTSDSARRAYMIELFRQLVPNIAAIEKQADKRKKEEEKQQQKQEKKNAKQRKKLKKQEAKKEERDAVASVKTSADVIKERLKIRKEPGLTAHWWWVKNYIRFRLLQEKTGDETKISMADVHEFLAEKLEKTPAYFKKQKDYKAQAEKLLDEARMAMGEKRFDALFVSADPTKDPPQFDKEAQLFWRGGVKKNGDDRITIVGVKRLLDELIVREKLKPLHMARFYEKVEILVKNDAFLFETLTLTEYPKGPFDDETARGKAIEEYEKARDKELKEFEAKIQQRTSEIYRDILEEERKEIAEAMFEEVRKGTKGNDVAYKKAWERYQEVQHAIVVREIELGRGVLAHLDQEFQKTKQELDAYATRKSLPLEWLKDKARKHLFLPNLKNKVAPYPVEVMVKALISGGGVAAGVYGADVSFHALSDASRLGPGEPLYDAGLPYLETIGAVKAGRLLQDQVQKRTMVRNRFWPAFHRQAFTHRAWELIPGPLRQSAIAGIRLFTGGRSALLNFEAFRDLRHAQEFIAKKHEIPMEVIGELTDNAWLLPTQMEDELNTLVSEKKITADQCAQAKTHLVEAARRIKGTWAFDDKDTSLLSKESKLKPRNILEKLEPEIKKLSAALEKEMLENGEREAFRVEESLLARLKKLVSEIPKNKWTSGSSEMQAYLEEKKDNKHIRLQEDTDRLQPVLSTHADTIRPLYNTHIAEPIRAGKQKLYLEIAAFAEQQKKHKQDTLDKAKQKKDGAENEGEEAKQEFLNRAKMLGDSLDLPKNKEAWKNAAAMHDFLDEQKTKGRIGEEVIDEFRDYLAQAADEEPKRKPTDIWIATKDRVDTAADKVNEDTKKAAEAEAEDMEDVVADIDPVKSVASMRHAIDAISEDRWISGEESMKAYLDDLVSEENITEEEKNAMRETLLSLVNKAAEKYASIVETKINEAKAEIVDDQIDKATGKVKSSLIKKEAEAEKDKKIQEVKDSAAIEKQLFEQGADVLFTRLKDDPFAWFGKGSMEARLDECKKDDTIGPLVVDRMKPRLLEAAEKVRGSGGKPEDLLKEVERRMVVAEAYQLANHHWKLRNKFNPFSNEPLFDEANYKVLEDIRKKLLLEIIPSELLLEREVEDEKTKEKKKEIEISFGAVKTFLDAEKKKLDALRPNISREKRNVWIKRIISLVGGGVAGYAIAPFSAMVFGAKAAKSAAAFIPLAIRKGK